MEQVLGLVATTAAVIQEENDLKIKSPAVAGLQD